MSEPFITISSREAKGRLILGVVIVAALIFGWFGIRWQLGTMLAELTPPNEPTAKYAADKAVSLSPRDPLAAWLTAETEKDFFNPANVEVSVQRYENVVRLAPYDYRWWVELGRADEQAEYSDRAELAFRRAAELAPSYAFPRWQLGNFLLRENRPDEAFAELRKITENDLTYREQVFSLAWDYFDHDPSKVEALAADTPEVRSSLSLFYAARGQAADSLRIWNTLNDSQKAAHPQTARTITQALTEKKFYRQGLEFSRQVGIDPDAQAETITNGGFEKALGSPEDNYYGWNVERTDNKLDIATDSSVKHQGNRSLRLNFRTFIKPELGNPWQIVAIEPSSNYTLHFWTRTENLKSAGMPAVEVVDPSDNRLIASSPAIEAGTNDWREFSIEFKAPDAVDGIFIRVARSYCGEACPIVGILWLDDFSLVRNSR
jgi:tetratricopeptide (TPR) repeat protein